MAPGSTAHTPGRPSTPRDAATVVLLRDGAVGLEAYLLTRVSKMAAFGGMTVFPGGSVDPGDYADVPWAGTDEWSHSSLEPDDPPLASALVCAAVRETFEETGVLLAGTEDTVAAVTDLDGWERDRAAVEAHELTLPAFLAARGLVLRADLLRPWAHWITPEGEPRRFDTRFFVAALPAAQQSALVTAHEAERAYWARPEDALAAFDAGRLIMVAPTATTLVELSRYARVADVFAAAEGRSMRAFKLQFNRDVAGYVSRPEDSADLIPQDLWAEVLVHQGRAAAAAVAAGRDPWPFTSQRAPSAPVPVPPLAGPEEP
jgi:8-oxo-dGTP pyrophosphatase MutT (NUDIX family)